MALIFAGINIRASRYLVIFAGIKFHVSTDNNFLFHSTALPLSVFNQLFVINISLEFNV